MKDQKLDKNEELEATVDSQEHGSKTSSSTKLERRRRIEEIDEEKRLREELTEY